MSLAEAATLVRDGDHLALGGFALNRNAIAFAHELIRQGRRDLTISAVILGMEADLLVGAGCVKKAIYGGGSMDRFGQLQRVNEGYEQGRIVCEYPSSLALAFRYQAGALGLPFMPIKSMLGSDLLATLQQETAPGDYVEMDDPFTGERLVAMRALVPDVAVVQVQQADAEGNCRVYGPRWDNAAAARAAKHVIVIAEELVSTDVIRQQPELTLLPGFRVGAVVPVPYGAHPTALFRCYDYDGDHLRLYAQRSKSQAGFDTYLREFVLEPSSHLDYLELVGGVGALAALKADALLGY